MKTKNKRIALTGLSLILLVFVTLVYFLARDNKFLSGSLTPDANAINDKETNVIPRNEAGDNSRREKDFDNKYLISKIVSIDINSSLQIYPLVENPPFGLTGATGGRFAIRNRDGVVIRRGSEDDWVFSISPSPNEKFIVVGAGDGNAYIINTSGEKILDLPQRPPGENMLGMGTWVWLSDDRLLGTSGLQKFDTTGKLISCCGGDNISESKFYLYDIKLRSMKEIQLPESISGKVLKIHRVLKSGEIQVAHEDESPVWLAITDRQ